MNRKAWIYAGCVLGLAGAAVLCAPATARAAFVISAQSSCAGPNVYAYNFSSCASMPDFTVRVSSCAVMPALYTKLPGAVVSTMLAQKPKPASGCPSAT